MPNNNINEIEWSDSKNWPGGIYRSRIDSRMFVPKRRGFGITLNFGNRNAIILFVALLALPLVVVLAVYFTHKH